MSGTVLVGTASWTDKSLIASKRFYPKGTTSAEARLRYYASRFPIVEVDSSYYAMPSSANAQLWAERTPAKFIFNIKAFRAMTRHQTPHMALPADLKSLVAPGTRGNVYAKDMPPELVDELWRRYAVAIRPLREAGKLGVVHFQFPPWFTATRDSYAYLDEVRERMGEHLVAVEFRHKSWFTEANTEALLAFLTERHLVNVVVDEPQGAANSIPSVWAATHPALALVRLHGRNDATWNIKDATAASDRFNYDYTEAELTDLSSPILRLSQEAAATHVIFNNNFEDQGPRNATSLRRILGDASPATW